MRIVAIGGSTRSESNSECALRVAATRATQLGAMVELIAGRDLMLPIYDTETRERSAQAQRLVEAVAASDGLVIATPGYHGMLSGMIKNALDYLEDLREGTRPYLDGRAVGCIAVATGWQATVSTLQGLRTTVHALRGWPTPYGAAVNVLTGPFDAEGHCTDAAVNSALEIVASQVIEFVAMRRAAAPIAPEPA